MSATGASPGNRVGILELRTSLVIARSACDEAIHVAAKRKMDCFAALAMTLRGLPHLPQNRLDRLALVGRQRRLRRYGVADIVALDHKPGLDAGREVVARKNLVNAP